ncbi:hypothetical protein DFH09DRAFT_1308819 [Mycena vulgaris]|nr:hypothetical protein DFH09DRAFT_1308819 [Mycena vulgaris]
MKFILHILALCYFYIATVYAQASHIGAPLPGATLKFNSNFTLQLVRPQSVSIQGSTEVGIAIGLLSCPTAQGPAA